MNNENYPRIPLIFTDNSRRVSPVSTCLGRLSEGIQKPLHIVMVAEQVEHDHVLLRLGEHDAALPAKPELEDSA